MADGKGNELKMTLTSYVDSGGHEIGLTGVSTISGHSYFHRSSISMDGGCVQYDKTFMGVNPTGEGWVSGSCPRNSFVAKTFPESL